MADGVKAFLTSLGMDHHFDMFQTRGYDDEADIPHLSVSDLQTIGVINPMEIIIILKAGEYNLMKSFTRTSIGGGGGGAVLSWPNYSGKISFIILQCCQIIFIICISMGNPAIYAFFPTQCSLCSGCPGSGLKLGFNVLTVTQTPPGWAVHIYGVGGLFFYADLKRCVFKFNFEGHRSEYSFKCFTNCQELFLFFFPPPPLFFFSSFLCS